MGTQSPPPSTCRPETPDGAAGRRRIIVTVDETSDPFALACSLENEQLSSRREEWRSLADRALIESRPEPGGLTALYRGDAETARVLEALVAAERRCCPGIDWRLSREGDVIRLDVTYEPERNAEISAARRLG